ncbi:MULTISPECIES: hypothetical protein [Niastella]|uniref:Uncharacterized protein n=1 Tax=Niastella soli TaxID=2821487 RepID=A0ABS3YS12_9BACT|nr:hypothetical protein [Niastella soli]MBO9200701.1 hypothetical protein [Niastella soli]
MLKKLNDLQFVIGLFFTVVSLILLLNVLLASNGSSNLNVYTGACFLVFGLSMIFIKGKASRQ